MDYLGDFAEDATVQFFFTTNDSNGGAVAPNNAFEAADVNIYKDGSATQKTSTNGLSMTSPFDSTTGLHHLSIDTSNDTSDAGFWVTGSDYTVVLSPDETVDSQTVVRVLGQFSIENRTTKPKADFPTNFADLSVEASNGRVDVGSWAGQSATLSTNNKPDVNVDEWADTPLATTNPLPNAAPDSNGGLPTEDASGHIEADVREWLGTAVTNSSTSSKPEVDAFSVSDSEEAANDLEASAATIVRGTAQTGTLSTTKMTTDLSEATDDHYNGRIIVWTSGVLKDQATDITDYDGTSKEFTFTAVTEAPSNGDTFVIV